MRRFLYGLVASTILVNTGQVAFADQTIVGPFNVTGAIQGTGPGPTASSLSGWSIGWNNQGGLGETDFINSKGSNAGGFSFFNTTPALWNGSTKPAPMMTLDGSGTLKPVALDLSILIGAGGATTLGQLLNLANSASSNAVIGSTTDLSAGKITPTGGSSAQSAAAIATLAIAALAASDPGLATAESKAGSALQPAAIGATIAAYNDPRIVGALASNDPGLATAESKAGAALPASKLGVASGAASLDTNTLVPSAQIPFGTVAGKVADGGALTTVTTTANSALQPSVIGSTVAAYGDTRIVNALQPANIGSSGTNGIAGYNDSRIVGALPANNAALTTAEGLAGTALQPGNVGSSGTNGVAGYSDPRITGAAPLFSPVLTGTPKLANTPASNDTSNDIVTAGWVANLITASGGHATAVASGTDISQTSITPTGGSTSQTAAAIAQLAVNAIASSLLGAANGVATLNSSSLIPSTQIPFGTTTGTVADGGVLNTVKTTANAAVPSSSVGAASGVASLNSSGVIPSAQYAFGTATGTVADGGILNTVKTTANAAIPSSQIGAASGVASLTASKFVTSSQIPFGTTSGTVADGGTLASVSTLASAAVPSSSLGAASGVATLTSGKFLTSSQIPFGTTSGTVADGGLLNTTTSTANAAIPSSKIGAASGVASLNSSSQIPSGQILFGTTTGTVADGGVVTSAINQATTNITNVSAASAQKSNNLSDLASLPTALSNLGGLSLSAGGTVSGAVTHTGSFTTTGAVMMAYGIIGQSPTVSGNQTLTPAMCGNTLNSSDTSNVQYTVPQGLGLNCRIQVIQYNNGTITLVGGGSGATLETLRTGPNNILATSGQYTGATIRVTTPSEAVVFDND